MAAAGLWQDCCSCTAAVGMRQGFCGSDGRCYCNCVAVVMVLLWWFCCGTVAATLWSHCYNTVAVAT